MSKEDVGIDLLGKILCLGWRLDCVIANSDGPLPQPVFVLFHPLHEVIRGNDLGELIGRFQVR